MSSPSNSTPAPPKPLLTDAEAKIFSPTLNIPITDYTPVQILRDISSEGWREDPEWQTESFSQMNLIFEQFTAAQREEAFFNSRVCVNRLAISGNEEAQWKTFHKIMVLPSDEDVRRALDWDPARVKAREDHPEEDLYLNMPGLAGEFVDIYKNSKVPAAFFAWASLALLGAVCKYNAYVQVGGVELLHNMFMFLVGTAASGKSYAKDCVQDVLLRLNRKLNTRLLQTPAGPESQARHMDFERPDLWINILPQDSTYEAIIEHLANIRETPLMRVSDDKRTLTHMGRCADAAGILMVDEVSEHFGHGDWAADKKLAGYTSMFTSTSRSKSTLGRGERSYDHQAFSMLACGAIEWFRGSVTPAMMKGGFVDRSLFIYRACTERIYTGFQMPVIDPIAVEDLAERLIPLATPPTQLRRRVPISPEAIELITKLSQCEYEAEIAIQLHQQAEFGYKTSAVRNEQRKIKIASLFAIAETPTDEVSGYSIRPIMPKHIQMAHDLVTAEQPHFDRFLQLVNLKESATFAGWVRNQFIANEWDPVSAKTFYQSGQKSNTVGFKDIADVRVKMQPLVDAGLMLPHKHIEPKRWRGSIKRERKNNFGWGANTKLNAWDQWT